MSNEIATFFGTAPADEPTPRQRVLSEIHNADRDRRILADPRNANLSNREREQVERDHAVSEPTTAEHVARIFGDDGMRFRTNDGVELDDICEAITSREWRDGYRTGDVYRYAFADGSAIVVAGDGWDIEGAEPFSWAGA